MFWHKNNKTLKDHPSIADRERSFVCTMHGPFELFIENYGSLGDYDEEHIVLQAWKSTLIIEGERLFIEYFTDIDMKVTGRIRRLQIQ